MLLLLLGTDECAGGTHNCDGNATCVDNALSFSCACISGYSGSGTSCTGIYDVIMPFASLLPSLSTAPLVIIILEAKQLALILFAQRCLCVDNRDINQDAVVKSVSFKSSIFLKLGF